MYTYKTAYLLALKNPRTTLNYIPAYITTGLNKYGYLSVLKLDIGRPV